MSDPDFAPTRHAFTAQRLQLNYVDWGNPDAPPLILVHGGRDHSRNWDWVARALRDEYHIVAPDLRGHGDSAWSPDGDYSMLAFVYDLAAFVHTLGSSPVTIIAHSLGGHIALRYAGLYPETVARLVAIEGLGPAPFLRSREGVPIDVHLRDWIERRRALEGRTPRWYATIEDAAARMAEGNPHLSPEQAYHLTLHGTRRDAAGRYGWKFDNHIRARTPLDITEAELRTLWARVTCPTLLVYGTESWATTPAQDDLATFPNARVVLFERAGHWVHHDRLDAFVAEVRRFLAE